MSLYILLIRAYFIRLCIIISYTLGERWERKNTIELMWFYIWCINSYHYSCTSMAISIVLLSTTQWNLIKLNYSFIIRIDENDSNVYDYVFICSQGTNIVDLFRYSKSKKFTPFSHNLHWGNSGMLQMVS